MVTPKRINMQRIQLPRTLKGSYKSLVASLANWGLIDLNGKTAAQIRAEVEWFLWRVVYIPGFDPIVDHRSELLHLARRYRLDSKYDYSVLMYSTWIEHTLNLILHTSARRKGISIAHAQAMLREASLRAKSTWLMTALTGGSLSNQLIARIQRLADSRNSFIHYKWNRSSREVDKDLQISLQGSEAVVRALQKYLRSRLGHISSRSRALARVNVH
jgi:hypothetical protein